MVKLGYTASWRNREELKTETFHCWEEEISRQALQPWHFALKYLRKQNLGLGTKAGRMRSVKEENTWFLSTNKNLQGMRDGKRILLHCLLWLRVYVVINRSEPTQSSVSLENKILSPWRWISEAAWSLPTDYWVICGLFILVFFLTGFLRS